MLSKEIIESMKQNLKMGVTVKVAPQLFPTPDKIARQMCEMINIQPNDNILEPEAGTGALINVCGHVWKPGGRLTAVEVDQGLCESLKSNFPSVNVCCNDFLTLTPESFGKFTKIIMNPPFKDHQDVKHILHAFNFSIIFPVIISYTFCLAITFSHFDISNQVPRNSLKKMLPVGNKNQNCEDAR